MVNLVSPKIVIDTSIGYCHVFVVHRVDLSSRSACRPIYSTLSQQQQRRLWVLTGDRGWTLQTQPRIT